MVQKCTRALDCPWCGRWTLPGENCDLWMKLAHGMGTQIIWELKQRLKQDSCCLTCSPWTIHLDICFNLFSPVRLPTEGGGFYWHVLNGLRSELLSTALCSLWKAWRITASCCGLCFSFWNGSPMDLMVWFLPPQPPHSSCWSGLSVTSWATRSEKDLIVKLKNYFTLCYLIWMNKATLSMYFIGCSYTEVQVGGWTKLAEQLREFQELLFSII